MTFLGVQSEKWGLVYMVRWDKRSILFIVWGGVADGERIGFFAQHRKNFRHLSE